VDLAAKDHELMAKHQDLHLLGVLRPKHPDHRLDEAYERRIDERPNTETSSSRTLE
jgi:hypothetical protein